MQILLECLNSTLIPLFGMKDRNTDDQSNWRSNFLTLSKKDRVRPHQSFYLIINQLLLDYLVLQYCHKITVLMMSVKEYIELPINDTPKRGQTKDDICYTF